MAEETSKLAQPKPAAAAKAHQPQFAVIQLMQDNEVDFVRVEYTQELAQLYEDLERMSGAQPLTYSEVAGRLRKHMMKGGRQRAGEKSRGTWIVCVRPEEDAVSDGDDSARDGGENL